MQQFLKLRFNKHKCQMKVNVKNLNLHNQKKNVDAPNEKIDMKRRKNIKRAAARFQAQNPHILNLEHPSFHRTVMILKSNLSDIYLECPSESEKLWK